MAKGLAWVVRLTIACVPSPSIRKHVDPLVGGITVTVLVLLIMGNTVLSVGSPAAGRLRARHYSGATQDLYEACAFLKEAKAQRVLVSSVGFTQLWIGGDVVSSLTLLDDAKKLAGIYGAVVQE